MTPKWDEYGARPKGGPPIPTIVLVYVVFAFAGLGVLYLFGVIV